MKKSMIRGLAIALALLLPCVGALAEVRTNASVWMRTGPGLDYDQITSLAEGKTLEYLGESSVDDRGVTWYKVSGGDNTGWVSSRYTELVGEDKQAANAAPAAEATAEPTAVPTVEPTAEPTVEPVEAPSGEAELPVSLPALNAGLLFSDSVAQDEPADEAPAPTQAPEAGLAQSVELSGYYLSDLVEAANAIGLISYRQVESEVPYQYYDDAVILAGNQRVESIVVYGGGYEVYGVSVGMDAGAARACLNAAGLDFVASVNSITFEHRADEGSLFTDGNGHDSCINLWVDEDDRVTEIDWSSYTG